MFKKSIIKELQKEGVSLQRAKNQYYLYKFFYMAREIAGLIVNEYYRMFVWSIMGIYFIVWYFIFRYQSQRILISTLCIVIGVIFLILDVHDFINFNKSKKLDEKKQEDMYTKKRDKVAEKIQNICLLNSKVISRKMWRKIKKMSPQSYKMLRSGELRGHCYITAPYILNTLRDNDLKLLWVLNTNLCKDYKYGHAIIKKSNWVYCPNERITYNAEKYFKSSETIAFCEFELPQYKFIQENNDISTCFNNPEKVIPSQLFDEFDIFCKENGGHRSPEDKQD